MKIKVLGRKELEKILDMPAVIAGVKSVYKSKAAGETAVWPLVEHHFPERNAVTDIRSGGVFGDINLHGLKMLNNFPLNAEQGLPTFTGMLMVFDSTNGLPLGLLDASYITSMRTGAAGAIAAQALAREDAEVLLMLGAGKQSIFQIAASLLCLPKIKKVYIADVLNAEHAITFAAGCYEKLRDHFGVDRADVAFLPVTDLAEAVAKSDVIITITPSRAPVIKKEWVKPGTHFSCIGADMVGKEEIDPELFRSARVYADDIEQCLRVGEMQTPYKTGVLAKEDIQGEIGQVLAGTVEGRKTPEDITIFDATGLAILDLITAKTAIQLAQEKQLGTTVDME